jgi:hypothetical protein
MGFQSLTQWPTAGPGKGNDDIRGTGERLTPAAEVEREEDDEEQRTR